MTIRKAIVAANGSVINVVSLPDDWSADDPKAWKPPPTMRLIDADGSAEPGGMFDDQSGFARRVTDPPVPEPPTDEQNRIVALEKTIQALVDNDVILRDALPDEIKDKIRDKPVP